MKGSVVGARAVIRGAITLGEPFTQFNRTASGTLMGGGAVEPLITSSSRSSNVNQAYLADGCARAWA